MRCSNATSTSGASWFRCDTGRRDMEALRTAPLRVGVIGVGNWARHGHLRVLDLLPHYTLQAVYSQRREAAEAAAREYRIGRVAASTDELIESDDIDLVLV